MSFGQAYQEDVQESKYVIPYRDPEQEKGSKYTQDKQAFNKLAFHGRAGNLSSRPQPSLNGNAPKLETAARFQKSRSKSRK